MKLGLSAIFVLWVSCVLNLQSQNSVDSLKHVQYTFPSGKISGEGNVLNGKPHGLWKNYYEDGKLKSIGKLNQGLTDSTWRFFTVDGMPSMKIQYSNGKKEGIRTLYSADGKVVSKERFEQDLKSGWSILFNEDEKLQARVFFKNGKEESRAAEFEEGGRIIILLDYKEGVLVRQMRVNRLDKSGRKTGNWVETDSLYKVKLETQYANNLKNGYLKGYDINGNLYRLEKYVDDVLQIDAVELKKVAVKKRYFPNGQVREQGAFLEDKPVGMHTMYDSSGTPLITEVFENGVLVSKGMIDNQGRKQGEWSEYYYEGEVKSLGSYVDDLKEGVWKYYYKNQVLEQQGSYSKGLQTGTWKWFYEDKAVLRVEDFANGKEEGFSFELLLNGDTLSSGEYYRGQREGSWFFRDGDQLIRGQFDAGEMNGNWFFTYDTGLKSFSGNFNAGLPEGKHQAWFDNGNLKWEGKYSNGLRQGSWTRYLPDGTPNFTIHYQDGIEKEYDGFKVFPDFAPADFESLFQKNPYIFY